MMQVRHTHGIAGAGTASGPTVVIDVFRAFSAAAYALAAGATEILLAAKVDEALEIAANVTRPVLMGEVGGVRPDEFDLGNSPGEVVDEGGRLAGRTIIHRSSAGTRCARAALAAGAEPLYVASLVVASATAAALAAHPAATIVASGESGVGPSVEDDICAHAIAGLLDGDRARLLSSGAEAAVSARAVTLRQAAFAHPDDVSLCTDTDRFDFAMRAEESEGLVRVHRVEI